MIPISTKVNTPLGSGIVIKYEWIQTTTRDIIEGIDETPPVFCKFSRYAVELDSKTSGYKDNIAYFWDGEVW